MADADQDVKSKKWFAPPIFCTDSFFVLFVTSFFVNKSLSLSPLTSLSPDSADIHLSLIHTMLLSYCRCGGSELCEHKRRRAQCRDCGGSAFCTPHGKLKSTCRDCGGSAICPHGKMKRRCKDCGGSACCTLCNCERLYFIFRIVKCR